MKRSYIEKHRVYVERLGVTLDTVSRIQREDVVGEGVAMLCFLAETEQLPGAGCRAKEHQLTLPLPSSADWAGRSV